MDSRKRESMGTAGTQPAPDGREEPRQDEAINIQAKAEPAPPPAVLPPNEQQIEAVKRALESPDYNWRSVDGIAGETGLLPETVNDVLSKDLAEVVIRSSIRDKKGRTLYTTRDHYKKKQSTWNRILSATSGVVK